LNSWGKLIDGCLRGWSYAIKRRLSSCLSRLERLLAARREHEGDYYSAGANYTNTHALSHTQPPITPAANEVRKAVLW
jgi:hypothetical protein